MSRNRPVPSIARGPQQFSQRTPQPMASPMEMPQIPQSPAISEDLAQEIYCRLVAMVTTQELSDADDRGVDFRELLSRAARISKLASKVYFEEGNHHG